MKALSIKDLKKTYNKKIQAVKGITLDIEENDFFALLGPNGAGKSTTISIVTSLVTKSSGKVFVFDKDLDTDPSGVKAYIGLVPQEFNFSIFEKVFDIITNQGGYYGLPREVAKERAEKYLKQLELWDKKDEKAMDLSGGMKRKLMIARALVHHPKLLILDEPTAGVDVETRRTMWKFLKDLNEKGTTIILTTHYLEEAEQLCKNIAIIDKGEIIENTSMKKLLTSLDSEALILDTKPITKPVKQIQGYKITKIDSTTLEVCLPKESDLNTLLAHLTEQNIKIMSIRNKTNRLEELFISLTNGTKKND